MGYIEFFKTTITTVFKITVIYITCILKTIKLLPIYFKKKFTKKEFDSKETVGIFHPYCNAGGGGERVLWTVVKALQKEHPDVHIAIYTGDLEVAPEEMINRVKRIFNIKINPVEFIYLHKRNYVEAEMYPQFTLLAQSIGSYLLGLEALEALQPDIFIDTMGYAFTYPLFKYIGCCRVGSYTHYPTISTDMLRHVYRRVISHNNRRIIASNPFFSIAKIIYYRLFAILYGFMGRRADVVMVNSSWTEDHINAIWKCPLKTFRVYPPCDIERLVELPLLADDQKGDVVRIVSVAQFRPEKNHPLMLRIMYELRSIVKEEVWERVRLILVGSCRHDEDKRRVKDMEDLSKHLAVDENVEFKLNIPYDELVDELQLGTIGLHTMWNEHFGISVVEGMAAGLIMVAHNSGGPRADIIETQPSSQTGFLATDAEEYAAIIANIIEMDQDTKDIIRNAARASVNRFSCEQFENEFTRIIKPLVKTK
ncbi:GDP-Man:Man(3)GlcNAc(2)-PP-Dol alpha-1,2-mannosyltransferase [Microplitis demolitor]|uniref:GDP-Man:Man(3)GlcNAc(2)-PP-Dol alpha-1,2-mannosyltransferase n=1 Tax=Microplitis demolitor TaxID=69319 RepID=UPI00043FFF08|nr:GDP-Man:Man(3)GlcNAc(2)-PP-Dol alpha-1,2-mannosyltransferase [Microplitis demolitor]